MKHLLAVLMFSVSGVLVLLHPLKAYADFSEDFESHSNGTSLSSLGYTYGGGYPELFVSDVGVNGTQGFEADPGSASGGFPGVFRSETGGKLIQAQIDVRMRNGGLVGSTGISQNSFDIGLFSSDFSQSVSGSFQRINGAGNTWGLRLSDSSGASSTFPFNQPSLSDLGLPNNQSGDWTDWLMFELAVTQQGATNSIVSFRVSDSGGSELLSTTYETDTSYLASGPMNIRVGSSNVNLIVDRIGHDNFQFTSSSIPEPGSLSIIAVSLLLGSVMRRRPK